MHIVNISYNIVIYSGLHWFNLYKLINDSSDNSSIDGDKSIEKMYGYFTQAMDYAQQSKEKFLEANDLEIEDTGSREAAKEMKKLAKQIKELYIPSVKEMGKTQGINLN